MTEDGRLVGRARELAEIMRRLHAGVGTVLVGEAGVGKSAVAAEVLARLAAENRPTLFLACGDWGGATLPTSLAEATRRAAVVVVDDAHLLDSQSARHLSQLIDRARTTFVATARSGDGPMYSLGGLWAAGACERLDLRPLPGDDARALLEQHLGGEVDDRLAQLIAHRTRGNPLLIRELLDAGVGSGALRLAQGSWQAVGELPLSSAVVDMIRVKLAGLDDEHLQALQMLALAQPLTISAAEQVTTSAVLEDLEARRLVITTRSGDEPALACAHPLYAEVLRDDLGLLRSRRLRRRLLAAMTEPAARTERQHLLAVTWRLDLGETVPPAELLECAELAMAGHPALAESLLRAALGADDADEGDLSAEVVDAALALAHLLVTQGRVAEADSIVNRIGGTLVGERQRARLGTVRVQVRTRLGEIAEALRLVGASLDSAPGETVTAQAQVLYAQLMLLSARLDEALRIGEPVLDHSGVDVAAQGVAAYTVVAAHSFAGRTEDTADALKRAAPVLEAARQHVPYGTAMAQVSTAIAHVLAGRFDAAARLGHRMQETARELDDQWSRPRAATVLGLLALYRGRPADAAAHLGHAIASLTPLDAMFVRYNLAFLARAAAQAGNLADAQQALQPPADAPVFPLYEADWQIAEAAVLAAHRRLDNAASHAMTAARTAADHGQWGIAVTAAHDAARYVGSAEAAVFLTYAADLVDGPLPPLMRDHADARAADDATALQAVGFEFERLGATLFAAEAAYAAAHVLYRDAARDAAADQAARAAELHGRCEYAFLPWAVGRAARGLTTRELQVALLAATGRPDRHISAQFGISVRTVETHLAHVYAKLHLSTRGQLASALADNASPVVTRAPS